MLAEESIFESFGNKPHSLATSTTYLMLFLHTSCDAWLETAKKRFDMRAAFQAATTDLGKNRGGMLTFSELNSDSTAELFKIFSNQNFIS